MQKLFLTMGALILVGAGCLNLGGDKTVSGDWYLAFDLPQGWVMVDAYQEPSDGQVELDYELDGEDSDIVLQNTDKPIVFDDITPDAEVPTDSYVTEGTKVTVLRLDPRRVIPDEAEDLGDGFFKLDDEYYLDAGENKYRFIIMGDDTNTAEGIILSAEVVTDMTSGEGESE